MKKLMTLTLTLMTFAQAGTLSTNAYGENLVQELSNMYTGKPCTFVSTLNYVSFTKASIELQQTFKMSENGYVFKEQSGGEVYITSFTNLGSFNQSYLLSFLFQKSGKTYVSTCTVR